LKELSIDIIANAPYGIGGPAGMDSAIVKKLHDALSREWQTPPID
jgi:hypothetical protein